MSLSDELLEISQRSVIRVNLEIIGDIVAVVPQWGRIEWKYPYGGYSQIIQIIQLLGKAFEITHAIAVTVKEGLDMHFINDGVLIPKGIVVKRNGY
jgi:hypothetical protein